MLSKYNIVTLFPKLIDEWSETGIISKAHESSLFELSTTNLRDYGLGDLLISWLDTQVLKI